MSLIAWLPLNGNTKNNGLSSFDISGSPVWVNGKLGKQALSLNSRLTFTIPEMVGAKTWSVAFWCVTFDDATLSSDWVDIMGMHDRKADNSATGEFRWETCYGSAKGVAIGQYNNGTYATMTTNGGTLQGTKGGWHHCVASTDFENGTVAIYLDGVLKYTKVHAGGWLLGDFWLGQTNLVNGAIQDVRIYNHALSVKEIKELNKGLLIHYSLSGAGSTNPNLSVLSRTLNNSSGNNGNFTHETVYYDGYPVRKFTCKTDNYTGGPWGSGFQKKVQATVGTKYTWSMYIRGSGDFTMTSVGHECGGTRSVTVSTEWQKFTHTWTLTDGAYTAWVFYGKKWALGEWIEVKDLKVEEGSVATPYIPNSGEAEYSTYAFNNTTLEEDLSGNGFNGTRTGITTLSGSPRYNTAIDFVAKTSHLSIPIALNNATALTMSVWAKLDEDSLVTSTNTSSNIIALGTNEFARFRIQNEGTECWYYINNGSIYATFDVSNIIGGDWHHYALTWQGGVGAKFYIDGVLKSTTNNTSLTIITAINVWKLGEYNTNLETMDGQLSDFRLYATALSADDIKALYSIAAEIDKSGKIYCSNIVET